MYIIEVIVRMIRKIRGKKNVLPPPPVGFGEETENMVNEECENHIYLPIDSTKRFLACKNCGHIIKNVNL
ncbi:MAG: hypothetical protein GX568_10155 [Candidatus Gastranaerophilales bacterium]|nr:hypothetical protein [Candidatus Gastranaerophilales bacterium]